MTSDNSFFELLDQINYATTSEDDVSFTSNYQDMSVSLQTAIHDNTTTSTHQDVHDPSHHSPSQANPKSVLDIASNSDQSSAVMSSDKNATRNRVQPSVKTSPLYEKLDEPAGLRTPPAATRAIQDAHTPRKDDESRRSATRLSPNHSRSSSQATTVSCDPSPQQIRHSAKGRSMSDGYEEMVRKEMELEDLKSPGMDSASVFGRLAKEAIPSPGPIKRNRIRRQSPVTPSGELVSDMSDDNSATRIDTRPKPTTPIKTNTRKRNRQVDKDEDKVALQPPAMKRIATEPILQSQRQPRHSPTAADMKARPSSSRKPLKDGFLRKPVAQQFFRGKVFFWLPNDEKLLGRRIRMDRSEEWGAERSIAVTPRVTHMIIEENWDYQYALRHLGLSALPKHIVVVNEKWISASIEMLQPADPHATRFQVKGYREAMERERQEQEQIEAIHTVEQSSQTHNGHEIASEVDLEFYAIRSPARQAPQGTDAGDSDEVLSPVATEDYEIPDSQLDPTPSSPQDLPRTPTRSSRGRQLLQSLEVKRDKRDLLPSTPGTPEDPHRRTTFVAERQMPPKPLRWNIGTPTRKRDRRAPLTDDTTPFVTPAAPTPSITGSVIDSPDFKDELDLAIDEMRDMAAAGAPSGEQSRPSSSDVVEQDGDTDDDRSQTSSRATTAKAQSKAFSPKSWQETFACMHAHEGSTGSDNPNAATIKILQEMADHYELVKDQWRLTAYRKAIGKLKLQKGLIATAEQARKINGIGSRIADKIQEIVTKGNLRQLDAIKQDEGPQDVALKLFTQVYGAGNRQAHKWIAEGHRTIDDLQTKALLTENQRVGVDHFEDFQQRIPRAEVTAHAALMNKICVDISWKLRVVVGGSYRRGAESSGDVDFLITTSDEKQPDHVLRSMIFDQLIPRLFEIGYLKVKLAGGDSASSESTKWHGAAVVPDRSAPGLAPSADSHDVLIPGNAAASSKSSSLSPPWRRVDILMVPPREWGAALLYFTGNDIFNRSMRLLARKKGYCLNQRGLYKDVLRGSNREKLAEGTLVEGRDEKRIFEVLGVPYRPPEHRIC